MKNLFKLFILVFLLLKFQSCQNRKSVIPTNPNILIIYADDLGYGDLSSYGGEIPTPNIDRIGNEGIRFTNFYVSAPASTPSRYSLLTGSYPQRSKHDLIRALMPAHMNERYLDVSEKTIAEYLKSDGYKTSLFGKWHLGFKNSEDMPQIHGFDEFSGFRGGCIDFFTHVYGQMGHDWYVDEKETREEGYSTDLITNHTIDFINQVSETDTPFFTYLSYNAPHYGKTDPDTIVEHTVALSEGEYQGYKIINTLQAPPQYIERFKHIEDPYRQAYAAMVSCMDDNIGRVLDLLEQKQILDNTIIWFISDNGGYSERYYGHADNGGLLGEKGTLWEGGIKIPSLLCWREKIQPGQVIHTPLCNVDVLPTLLSVLNIPEQKNKVIDGIDISPVIFERQHIERTIFWEYNRGKAIREGKWKLLNNKLLFNLEEDPSETTDVSEQYPEIVENLSVKYTAIQREISEE